MYKVHLHFFVLENSFIRSMNFNQGSHSKLLMIDGETSCPKWMRKDNSHPQQLQTIHFVDYSFGIDIARQLESKNMETKTVTLQNWEM